MAVKIEIKTDGYPLPEGATLVEVMNGEINQLTEVLNALEAEKESAEEKHKLLSGMMRAASDTGPAG